MTFVARAQYELHVHAQYEQYIHLAQISILMPDCGSYTPVHALAPPIS